MTSVYVSGNITEVVRSPVNVNDLIKEKVFSGEWRGCVMFYFGGAV